jgi:AraC-like DNA-binding protein
VRPGDVAIVRGPGHYTVADDPATAPSVVIEPGQVCRAPDGTPLEADMALGVRTWGNDPEGETMLLTGTYEGDGELSRPLVRALPPLLVVAEGEADATLVALLAEAVARDAPGQEAVLDRLLDLLLIATLRAWWTRAGAEAPGWYRAHADPVVGRALRLLTDQPDRPWTVASLASAVSLSRAALARRFHELVGEPPMAFLTSWRLALAADLLRGSDATIDAIASQVGYGSAFSLSTAFRRERGVRPSAYRRTA